MNFDPREVRRTTIVTFITADGLTASTNWATDSLPPRIVRPVRRPPRYRVDIDGDPIPGSVVPQREYEIVNREVFQTESDTEVWIATVAEYREVV